MWIETLGATHVWLGWCDCKVVLTHPTQSWGETIVEQM